MQFRLLGPLAAVGSGKVAELGPPKERALLAILLLHVGKIVPVDQLISLVWGAAPPRTAAHSIQIYVSHLRRTLEELGGFGLLVTRQPGYVLVTEPDAIDARRFEDLVRRGAQLLDQGDADAARRVVRDALDLWHGPVLSDFAYEEFAQPHIHRLNDMRLDAVELYATACLEAGRITEALDLLTAAVQDDPLRERSRELLMQALYRSGRHADALRTFDALRTQLAEELGADPSPQIRALYDQILLHDSTLLRNATARHHARVTLAAEGAGMGGDGLGVELGFDRAVSDFGLVTKKQNTWEIAASTREWSRVLRELSEEAPALLVSADFQPIDLGARDHPSTHYLTFDDIGTEPNVSYVAFRECEASYLAGTAAALTSETGIIGFIGGWDAIGIWAFRGGYEAGARATNPNIRILEAYAADWPDFQGFADTELIAGSAQEMFGGGADVIFAAAGAGGLGVVSAAAEMSRSGDRHLWAIGVDTDWYEDLSRLPGVISPRTWRSHVLTSVQKRFDLAVYEALRAVAAGARPPQSRMYDLASGFVGISFSGGFLDGIRPLLEDERRRIISGKIRVPCIPDDHVDAAREQLRQRGRTFDAWLAEGCPPWRPSLAETEGGPAADGDEPRGPGTQSGRA